MSRYVRFVNYLKIPEFHHYPISKLRVCFLGKCITYSSHYNLKINIELEDDELVFYREGFMEKVVGINPCNIYVELEEISGNKIHKLLEKYNLVNKCNINEAKEIVKNNLKLLKVIINKIGKKLLE